MFEQRSFTDANGVRWLNRPGPARGVPALVVPLLALLPGQIVRLVVGASFATGLFVYAGCLYVRVQWSFNQTCPRCHNTRARGYTTCSGCGYPQSWS
jgi:hypothetical protein